MGKRIAQSFMGYQTTSRWLTEATPFALAYGMEVIIPTKIGMPTAKTVIQDQRDNLQFFASNHYL